MKQFKVDVSPALKRLEVLSKKRISGVLSGEFRSILKGRGLEFHGYRNYNAAEDDARKIDWKASLRSRYLVVKELVEERNNQVLFLIDASSTMSFSSVDKLKNEYVIEMFASLAHTLLTEGDSVGLALFSDQIHNMIIPNIGNKQFFIMLQTLTNPVNYEGDYDLENVLRELTGRLIRKTIIIIVSDFIGLYGEWFDRLKLLSTKHEIIAIAVQDPRDLEMPADVRQVFVEDSRMRESLLIDTKIVKDDYEKLMKEQNEELARMFKAAQVDNLFLTTDKSFKNPMFMFFMKRNAGG